MLGMTRINREGPLRQNDQSHPSYGRLLIFVVPQFLHRVAIARLFQVENIRENIKTKNTEHHQQVERKQRTNRPGTSFFEESANATIESKRAISGTENAEQIEMHTFICFFVYFRMQLTHFLLVLNVVVRETLQRLGKILHATQPQQDKGW